MSPFSRRALLATAATGSVGGIAGCGSLLNSAPSPPSARGLDGTAVFAADGVDYPATDAVSIVDEPSGADVAVFPSAADPVEPVARVLEGGTPVAVAGPDAQRTVLNACDTLDRSYGVARDGWGNDTRVAAAVPSGDRLDTHLFVGAELPRDLPWALGELLGPAGADCVIPVERPTHPDGGVLAGVSRIRGVNDVGEFDRWDRVRYVPDSTPTPVVVETAATIVAGRRGGPRGAYRADRAKLVAEFDDRIDAVGPAAGSTGPLSVWNRSDPTENRSIHEFTPETDAARRSFTACQRTRVITDEFAPPFSYTANARFRWRDPQLLEDDTWAHHTPGRAVWYF